MDWPHLTSLIGIALLGGIGAVFFRRRRGRRLILTSQTLRCPVHDCRAALSVRTDSIASPGRRYVDVSACSLLPATSLVPPVETAYLPDVLLFGPHVREASQVPHHSSEVACPKRCLHVLNAAECALAQPIRCTSGTSDSLELARQTQSPAMIRQLWFHST